MSAFLAPFFGAGFQSLLNSGAVNAGGHVLTYLAGSTTPQATWTDSTQAVSNGISITLDSAGRPGTPSNVEIWLAAGVAYKFQITDVNNVNVGPAWDWISGINDTAAATGSQWVASGLTPTYVSATQFTVPGDQTAVFQVGRRLQYTLGSGTKYGSISASAFGAVTTVTVLVDVTALDNTLSIVNLGLLTPDNSSEPVIEPVLKTFTLGIDVGTAVKSVFTPTLTIGGSTTGITYTVRQGSFTRIANRVHFSIYILLSSKGGLTGGVTISGLPVAAAATPVLQLVNANDAGTCAVSITNALIAASATVLSLYNAAGAAIQGASVANTGIFILSGTYQV